MESKKVFYQNNIQLGKALGKGSFGEVYSGSIKGTNQIIAIKRVNKRKIAQYGDYLVKAFFKELECMKKCNCENSVKLIDYFETNNNYNIIMELCDNDLSKELLFRTNGFNVDEVRYIMSQLNNVFRKLVENEIIHRDLKLGNILITYTDESKTKFIPKLCDYGFSKELKDKEGEVTETHLGTPATMAPEIMRNQPYNSKADLWSVGVLMYQLHFNQLPYQGGKEQEILKKIEAKTPLKNIEDPFLKHLINHLLVENPEKRYSWEEYFNHPFFLPENERKIELLEEYDKNKDNIINNNEKNKYIDKDKRYIYKQDFDLGFQNDMLKACIAYDTKKKISVIIKTYSEEFYESHKLLFKMEFNFFRSSLKNTNNILLLLNQVVEEKYIHLVFNYTDFEILPNYLKKHKFDENQLKIFIKELLDNVFIYTEFNFKPFIFLSPYSFAITPLGKPLLFDFGLNKFLLSSEEIISYYTPNKAEIAESIFPIKTNVMNFGITLLKCFYGNDCKIRISNNEIILPENINMSKDFRIFLSKFLYKNISKRSSWLEISKDPFIISISNNPINNNEKGEDKPLLNDKIMKGILKSLDTKYDLINKYYDLLKINDKTPNINEIEYFLILTLFEILAALNILNKKEEKKYNNIGEEISFISIVNDKVEKSRIIFEYPNLENMNIFNMDAIFIKEYISKFEVHLKKLKEIILKFHKITKSSYFKSDYQNFLREFSNINLLKQFRNYFISFAKDTNQDWFHKNYDSCKLKAPIAEYLSETVLFIKMSILDLEKENLYYQREELNKQLKKIFEKENEDDIQVSCVKLNKGKERYILVSLLGKLFKYLVNSMAISENDRYENKALLKQLCGVYQKLMETLVNVK